MDLKQLKYFVTIAEEKSISKAAKKLYMTQPPLSSQMKNLEEELKVQLFERGNKEIELTEAGRILYKKAKTLIKMADITVDEISSIKDNSKKTIRIGVVSSVVDYFVSEKIKDFNNIYNDYRYELVEANTYELLDDMENGIIDCAVIRTPYNNKNYEAITLKKEQIYAIGSNINNNINIDELSKHDIILYRRWKDIVEEEFSKRGYELKIKCLNDDARTTISLVNNDIGIGLVPESTIKYLPENINYSLIKGLDVYSDIIFVYKKDLNNQTQLLVNYLKGC